MALLGERKTDLQISVAKLESQVEFLSKENEHLKKQVETLQTALVAKVSPLAYSDMKADESAAEDNNLTSKNLEKWEAEMEFGRKYVASIEKPLFDSAEDMIDKLTAVIGGPKVASESVHNNDES